MSARYFNDLVVRNASTAEVALERLLNQEIVNRFTGASFASYDGPINPGSTSLGAFGSRGRILASSGGTDFTWNRTYAFVGSTFDLDSTWFASRPTLSNGCHMHFFNCTFLISTNADRFNNQLHFLDADEPNRSLNFYGCNVIVDDAVAEFYMSDSIYCNWKTLNGDEFHPLVNLFEAVPSRLIGTTFSRTGENQGGSSTRDQNEIQALTRSAVSKSPTFENCVIDNGFIDTIGGPTFATNAVLSNIQFTNNRRSFPKFSVLSAFSDPVINGYLAADRILHNVGGTYPPSNLVSDMVVIDFDTPNPSGYITANNNSFGGGVINYYGWKPRFLNEFNQPVANVVVRASSNVPLSDPTAVPTKLALKSAIMRDRSTVDRTDLPYNSINQYTTNISGFADFTGASYSTDGGMTFNEGSIDWFRLGVVSSTENSNKLASTFENASPPDNVIVLPIQDIRGTPSPGSLIENLTYNQYGGRIEARSYLSVIDYDSGIQNGVIGTGLGNQPANGYVPIEEFTIEAPNDRWVSFNRIGTVFDSEQTALLFLNTVGDRSPQELADYLKAVWANFQIDTLRRVSDGNLVWTQGPVTISPTNTDSSISDSALEINRVSALNAETSDRPVTDIQVPNNTLTVNCPVSEVDLEGFSLILNGDTSMGRYRTASDNTVTIGGGTIHTNSTFLGSIELPATETAAFNNCDIEGGIKFGNVEATFTECVITGTINSPQTIDRIFSGGRYTGGIDVYGGNSLTFNNAAIIDPGFTLPEVIPALSKSLNLEPGTSPTFRAHAEAQGWEVGIVTGDYTFVVGTRAGNFLLLNRTQNTISHSQQVAPGGSTIIISENDPSFAQGDDVRAYYRPLNNYTVGSEEWYETGTFDFAWDTADISRTIMMGPVEVPAELRSDTVYLGTDGNPATVTPTYDPANAIVNVAINNADQTGTGLSSAISKNLMIRAQDSVAYITAMATSDRVQDLIRPATNGTILDTSVTLTTDLTANIQQQMQGLQGGFTINNFTGTSIPTVNNLGSELGLTIPDAQEAVDRSIVANGVGYMVGNEDSALVGIAPRNNGVDYDSTTNYRGNI